MALRPHLSMSLPNILFDFIVALRVYSVKYFSARFFLHVPKTFPAASHVTIQYYSMPEET